MGIQLKIIATESFKQVQFGFLFFLGGGGFGVKLIW